MKNHSDFHFTSVWHLPADPQAVWDVLADFATWDQWWPGVAECCVTSPGTQTRLGERIGVLVRSPLGYGLSLGMEVTSSTPPHGAQASVSGDLVGTGRLECHAVASGLHEPPSTQVMFVWDVSSDRLKVRAFSPLASWAHGRVMRAGERALHDRLTPHI